MKNPVLVLFISLLAVVNSTAQQANPPKKNKESFWSADRIVYGGIIDARFGTITYVNLSPTIGYKITNRYHAGLGPVYMYYSINDPRFYQFSANIYGAAVYNRFYVFDYLFLHGEFQPLNGPWDSYYINQQLVSQRYWINNVWVGGGLSQPIGSGVAYVMGLFNINASSSVNFPPSPRISVGFAF